jgi:hypothetical protein
MNRKGVFLQERVDYLKEISMRIKSILEMIFKDSVCSLRRSGIFSNSFLAIVSAIYFIY